MASKKCIGKIKVNICVLKPTYWLFTSTRSFVAQFLPPQCTPGTQMPSWCTAWHRATSPITQPPQEQGSCNKMASSRSRSAAHKKASFQSLSLCYGFVWVWSRGCGSQAFYLSPSLGIMRRPDWFKVGILSGTWSVYRRWAAFGANLDLGQLVSLLPFQIQCWGNCCQLQSIANAL